MSIVNSESILKLLNSYNPWWVNSDVPQQYTKPMKRLAYYESKKALMHNEIRRFIILSGARRVGKTTILYQQIKDLIESGVNPKNILYVSFDNPLLKFCTIDTIFEVYNLNISYDDNIYMFLDEIQYVEDWNTWLKVFYDTKKELKVVATGSASPILEKGIVESGTGRWITINVPTLSFYEYCELLKVEVPKLDDNINIDNLENLTLKEFNNLMSSIVPLQKHFNRYITVGGFPELVLSSDDIYSKRILREDIVDKVLKRDIPVLFNIRNITILEKVFLYLCFNTSNIINYTTMSKELDNTSLQTIQEYIRYLENANLIYVSEPVNTSSKAILKSRPKIYIVDSAIRNAVLMYEDILENAEEMGYVVETAVFRQVYTRFGNSSNIGYLRDTRKDKEIDIVVQGLKEDKYIEVKYREDSKVKQDNPLYSQTSSKGKIYVVTKNNMDYSITNYEDKKIVRIPAFAFLYLMGRDENIDKLK